MCLYTQFSECCRLDGPHCLNVALIRSMIYVAHAGMNIYFFSFREDWLRTKGSPMSSISKLELKNKLSLAQVQFPKYSIKGGW